MLGSTQGKSVLGWIFILLNVIYVISGVILKIVLYFKNKYDFK